MMIENWRLKTKNSPSRKNMPYWSSADQRRYVSSSITAPTMREPSSGGMGKRLNTPSTMLIEKL